MTKMTEKTKLKIMRSKKIQVMAGDYKHKTYVFEKFDKKGYVLLKDLYGLDSKRKVYSKKFNVSNLKVLE